MQRGFVGEDKPSQDSEAENMITLSMEPDATGRSRNQKACCRLNVNCASHFGLDPESSGCMDDTGISSGIQLSLGLHEGIIFFLASGMATLHCLQGSHDLSLRGAWRRGNLKFKNRDCFATLAMTQ